MVIFSSPNPLNTCSFRNERNVFLLFAFFYTVHEGRLIQGAKKVCLIYSLPFEQYYHVLPQTSLKKHLMSRIDYSFSVIWIPKNVTFPFGKLRTAKSTSCRLSDTTFFARCSFFEVDLRRQISTERGTYVNTRQTKMRN